MPHRLAPVLVASTLLLACSDDPSGTGSTSRNSVVVFHTASAVRAVREDDIERTRFRTRIDDFFPAACVDRDDDDDGIPNTHDHHSRGRDHDDDDDRDGGVDDDDDRDGGVDEDGGRDGGDDLTPIERSHRCHRCNRGPGESGDFRLEIRGDEARLDRGTAVAASDGALSVASPDGAIRVLITAATEVRAGTPAPGAEIRVEGAASRDAANALTITATRLEVLCAAPAPMPEDEVPAEAQPVPALD
jgi:hypothetical protein